MDPSTPTSSTNLWMAIGTYILTTITSVIYLYWQTKKDRASIEQIQALIGTSKADAKKTEAEAHQLSAASEVASGQLSLEWAREFRERLEKVENDNRTVSEEVTILRREKAVLELKIVGLEHKIADLETENNSLKKRILELEAENRTLRHDMKNINGG